jgi:hypothetical protein
MKKILLLICGSFLISQASFGKEINSNTLVGNSDIANSELEPVSFNNSAIFKKPALEKNRVWLNLANAEGAFKQLLVGYITGATNGWDKLFDSVTIDSNPYIDFYSINGGKNLTIQGRALPFVIADEVPLGYKTNITGTFEISIDHFDGFFVNQDIFLKDNLTGVIHNLKNGDYSFTTDIGRFNDRFVLLYVTIPVEPTPPSEPVVAEVTDPVVPTPTVPDPVVTVPEVPVVTVPDPVVTVPEVPAVTVPDPVVTVPEVPAVIVPDPVVTVPEVPAVIVPDPVVTVPEVPAPIVPDPVVTVPEVPAIIVPDPVVTVPEVPVVIVPDPVVMIPEVPAIIVPDPIVTVPEVPAPIVPDPVVAVPEVPAVIVPDPVVTVPEVPVVIVPDPVVIVPEVPVVIVPDPIVTIPEVLPPFDIVKNVYGAKEKSVIVSVNNNQITINSTEAPINQVFVYNMGQTQLFERNNINSKEFVIDDIGAAKQVLIIRTQLRNGKLTTSKIIL